MATASGGSLEWGLCEGWGGARLTLPNGGMRVQDGGGCKGHAWATNTAAAAEAGRDAYIAVEKEQRQGKRKCHVNQPARRAGRRQSGDSPTDPSSYYRLKKPRSGSSRCHVACASPPTADIGTATAASAVSR